MQRFVLRVTRAPVLATHSSLRHFTPGWERNMADDMVRALTGNGGVIMINFGSSFLRTQYQDSDVQRTAARQLRERGMDPNSPEGRVFMEQQRKANPVGTVEDVADHIDHVVHLVGVEHVGLGSDYDGVFALPAGLLDVSTYPNLITELLERGYSEADIKLILGENLLRVWSEVERIAGSVDR